MILAIDPGKDKCGLAVLDFSKNVLEKKILPRKDLPTAIPLYIAKYHFSALVVGRSHFGKELEKEFSKMELKTNVVFVSEKYSTLEARRRYWQENKPKGFRRFIPATLRLPPVPIDDYAAVILGERYLEG